MIKKIPYVCNVNDKDEDFEVRLYDNKDCLLFASKAKIFSGFFAVDVEEELHIMHSHREMLIPLLFSMSPVTYIFVWRKSILKNN